jgi:hypothetical protein
MPWLFRLLAQGLDLKVWPRIQFEICQCGVWKCWAPTIFPEQLRIGAPLITAPFHEYFNLDGETNEDGQLVNTSFIMDIRVAYTKLLK